MLKLEDDDDGDIFTPVASCSLTSLFQSSSRPEGSLRYSCPRQTGSDPLSSSISRNGNTKSFPSLLFASPVHLKMCRPHEEEKGRVVCAVVHDRPDEDSKLLLYRDRYNHLMQIRLTVDFCLQLLPSSAVSIEDCEERKWILEFEPSKIFTFLLQVIVCKGLSAVQCGVCHQNPLLVQDVSEGEGLPMAEGHEARVAVTFWTLSENYCAVQWKEPSHIQKASVSAAEPGDRWTSGLLGVKPHGRRIILSLSEDEHSYTIYLVHVLKVRKKKPCSSSPDVEGFSHSRNVITSSMESLDVSVSESAGSMSKEAIMSRIVRVGQPLLPTCKLLPSNVLQVQESGSTCEADVSSGCGCSQAGSASQCNISGNMQRSPLKGIPSAETPLVLSSQSSNKSAFIISKNDTHFGHLNDDVAKELQTVDSGCAEVLIQLTRKVDEIHHKLQRMGPCGPCSAEDDPDYSLPVMRNVLMCHVDQFSHLISYSETISKKLSEREEECRKLNAALTEAIMKNQSLLEEMKDFMQKKEGVCSAELQKQLAASQQENSNTISEVKNCFTAVQAKSNEEVKATMRDIMSSIYHKFITSLDQEETLEPDHVKTLLLHIIKETMLYHFSHHS